MSSKKNMLNRLNELFGTKEDLKRKTFLILGAGKFGSALAKRLTKLNQIVIIVDKDQEKIDNISVHVDLARQKDATQFREIEDIDFSSIDYAVISVGSNIEASFLSVLHLQKLIKNKENITVNYSSEEQGTILRALGVKHLVRPEQEAASNQALHLIFNNISELFEIDDNFIGYELVVRNLEFDGKTIEEVESYFKDKLKIMVVNHNGETKFAWKDTIIHHMDVIQAISLITDIDDISSQLVKKNNEEEQDS